MICPCQDKSATNARLYEDCCESKHKGLTKAQSAEELMRSRYSAFFLGLGKYIFDTHHADFRNGTVEDYTASAQSTNWCRLEVLESEQLESNDKVNFKAYFFEKDKLHCMHEISNFVLEANQWFYTDGEYQPKTVEKIARNDQCPCQSGLKAKKCHLLI
ncbi:YchJ family protein [Kangiella sp. HZ709]|uniref:YchJ family protein n=1 Tax=Kangiella sp. HZ709 TaxID=2666328 RepID=UPI0012AF1F81|nr:YchJ family metal-binding protein [Kangiella sp. HZ709]MRX27265.1 zinc chelation protein SecC [Kangiella sp. HZ709]